MDDYKFMTSEEAREIADYEYLLSFMNDIEAEAKKGNTKVTLKTTELAKMFRAKTYFKKLGYICSEFRHDNGIVRTTYMEVNW